MDTASVTMNISLQHLIESLPPVQLQYLKSKVEARLHYLDPGTEELSGPEKEMALQGNRLGAVKSYRGRTLCGLRESCDMVDAYRTEILGPSPRA